MDEDFTYITDTYNEGEVVNIDGDKHMVVHVAIEAEFPYTVRRVDEHGQLSSSGIYRADEIRGLWKDIRERIAYLTEEGQVVDANHTGTKIASTRVTFIVGQFDE
jgi:hypothetical protein